jgi:hypothetical protein
VNAYILTRATPRLRSHDLAASLGLCPILVCDDGEQRSRLIRQFGVSSKHILVCEGAPGPPTGAAFKRDWIAREVAPRGKWLVWLDDNVEYLTGLPPRLSKDRIFLDQPCPRLIDGRKWAWREAFAYRLTKSDIWCYIRETLNEAERLGTINCGFATEENYFFRARKWQTFGYCRSQFTLYKNDGSGWMPYPGMMFEDMYKTADVIARYGCVVVNRHMKAVKPVLFEPGGIGSLEERKPHLVENCRWLMDHYPGLLRYSKGRDYHVTFAKTSFRTVNNWRRENGYL